MSRAGCSERRGSIVYGGMKKLLFPAALLAAFSLPSCDADDDGVEARLTGEWALARTTGGIAGVDTTYARDNPPAFVTIGDDGTFAFRHAPGHAGIPDFAVAYAAALVRTTDTSEVYDLTLADADLEGTAAFAGQAELRGDELDFFDPDLTDGFKETYRRW